MGLGLRGVRGRGVAGTVGVTEAPLEGGPNLKWQITVRYKLLTSDLLHINN